MKNEYWQIALAWKECNEKIEELRKKKVEIEGDLNMYISSLLGYSKELSDTVGANISRRVFVVGDIAITVEHQKGITSTEIEPRTEGAPL